MEQLTDRVAVVTGACGGIGRALVLELARTGMHLVLADLDEQAMRSLASEVAALGRRCTVVPTDVRHAAQVEHLLAQTLLTHGDCHLMVNNAGVLHAAPLLEASAEHWQRVVDVNLWGVLHGCRVFGQHFARQHEGHIVNMASAGGLFPSPGMTLYSTTKFAVIGFTQQLRWELAADGVGVTLVIPGLVKTGIFQHAEAGLGHLDVSLVLRTARSPQGLARKVRRAVQRDRPIVYYGFEPLLFGIMRVIPSWLMDPLAKRFTRLVLKLVRARAR
ncbi:MAG: SDR family NAD(P)-dependent oxidoreductase [Polyangiales bacterium]